MGKWVHRITNIDINNKIAQCSNCGIVPIIFRNGLWICKVARMKWHKNSNVRDFSYLKYKGHTCERCGFLPLVKEQLDVDHINGDPLNSKPNNLMTLCANCHRLKTARPDLF